MTKERCSLAILSSFCDDHFSIFGKLKWLPGRNDRPFSVDNRDFHDYPFSVYEDNPNRLFCQFYLMPGFDIIKAYEKHSQLYFRNRSPEKGEA